MSDNKLKIRIQIQQPPQAIEQIYPDLPEPEIIYEQIIDWKKISIAAAILVLIFAVISYLLFSSDDQTISANEATPTIAQPAAMQADNVPVDKIAPASAPAIAPAANETKLNESSSARNDSQVSNTPKAPPPTEKTTKPASDKAIPIPKLKPELKAAQPITAPAKKPKSAVSPDTHTTAHDTSDHPQVVRAQLSHDIKAREPVDSIDSVQLLPGKSMPIYFYLQLKDMQGKKVSIFWYHNDKLDSQLPLEIRNDNWRTNASKHLDHQRLGAWRVELVDGAGNLLAKRSFTVTKQ
ncbi:MAG: DUF2914 domain-containing protein [Nitrosomonas sp.]|nr:DUF2914 domain-containing protein [Nitrosomonas sp.]